MKNLVCRFVSKDGELFSGCEARCEFDVAAAAGAEGGENITRVFERDSVGREERLEAVEVNAGVALGGSNLRERGTVGLRDRRPSHSGSECS